MLKALKFVQGAVARKDFVNALTHFRIRDGQIMGYNGALSLSCPIPLDINCMPKATPFIKAIQTCREETTSMHLTPSGRLSIKSGAFKVLVECIDEGFPDIEPEGDVVKVEGSIQNALKILEPFIAEDASRPWARGILFRGRSAFATNNVVLMEKWVGHHIPIDLNIPRAAVVELLRIGEEPVDIQVTHNSATFHFTGHRWLKTQLYSTEWPDLSKVLDKDFVPEPFPAGFFEALEDMAPFSNKLRQVFLTEGRMQTEQTDEQGAQVEVAGIKHKGLFNLDLLLGLKGTAEVIDLSSYPRPCLFTGNGVRGCIIGMRS